MSRSCFRRAASNFLFFYSRTFCSSTGSRTHFGFQDVASSEKQGLVSEVFARVAPSYDRMNDIMSLGVHRLWKDSFVHSLRATAGMKILDCAGGTGDIAFRIIDERMKENVVKSPSVTVCDVNPKMLEVGRERAMKRKLDGRYIEFVVGNAENLPMTDNSFDAYVISFGMRNVPKPERALQEAYRVLRPGGRFMMLEFAKVSNPLLSQVYDAYSFEVIPRMGAVFANDRQAYQYLVESIRQFPGQEEFLMMMRDAGFVNAKCTDYTFGVCAQYSGFKDARKTR